MAEEISLVAEELDDGTVMIWVVSPNQPKTPLHSFRVDNELWEAAKAKAAAEDRSLGEVLRELLWVYVTGGDVTHEE